MNHYNTIIIGGGIAGYSAAAILAQEQNILLLEKHHLGGTCLNYGCIPTKTLLESSHTFANLKNADTFGIEIEKANPNIAKMIARKNKIVSTLRGGIEEMLKSKNVTVINQEASLKDNNTIEIKETGETFTADNIIIASGSKQREIPNLTPDGEKILSSDQILNLEKIPESILIVGGGVIGCELATFLSELGTKVTIAEIMPDIMGMLDKDIHKLFLRTLKKKKIKVLTSLKKIEVTKNKTNVTAVLENEKSITQDFEMVLNAAGRISNLPLGIENTDIKYERNTIVTNESLQTSVPNIYALGDVTNGPMLAHRAAYDATIAAKNILGDNKTKNYEAVPYCTYTHPEITAIGLTQEQAEEQDINIKTSLFSMKLNGRAHSIGSTDGALKLIADTDANTLIGAHILCPHASEITAMLSLAIKNKISLNELSDLILPHPTISEAIGEALHELM